MKAKKGKEFPGRGAKRGAGFELIPTSVLFVLNDVRYRNAGSRERRFPFSFRREDYLLLNVFNTFSSFFSFAPNSAVCFSHPSTAMDTYCCTPKILKIVLGHDDNHSNV